ncbi:MAG TPA: signal peptide peptidase SppA [Candidatus Obscuribacter sp.]|nr:signal peptide peptidase SppA [Candidatus Obscuribacter sp.]MBK9279745.1 signal peptide peptidase SppA [Candidatus Obscuribacter sp.]MBL8081700.1 signal peptide peptidase SppA [Candidatus Obscuribacter sp.]HNB17890.1 signal peptide peptidase SppA [Candidatus Obscuribacter sp.]
MRINQRWFVWIILTLCVLAIPVAVLTQGLASAPAAKDGNGSGLMTKFKDRIQVVKLSGMIIDKADSGLLSSSAGSATETLKDLRKAIKNDKVKGVLLRVNSPGGTVPTSQEIYEAVKELKKKNKIVVVSMGDMAASGGYYVSCAADKIVANPGTLTGSIGVIMNLMNFKALADKVGIEPEVVKSGLFKDIASPYHKMTKEERQILTDLIMDSYDQFTQVVAEGRALPIEEVKRIADGRIYSGRQAKAIKLVDELGTYSDALALLQKLCKERFKNSADLPVEDVSNDSFLATLLESAGAEAPPLSGKMELSSYVPVELSPALTRQPLWLYR